MRILIIEENYPKYLQQFYSRNNIGLLTYDEHFKLLSDDHFGTGGTWTLPLAGLGYEVTEVYHNNEKLQHHWLREFGTNGNYSNYKKFEIVFFQIKHYKPDVLFVTNPHVFDESVVRVIKKEFPFIKLFICYLGTPYTSRLISEYDICFTTLNKYSKEIVNAGKHAFTLPHAFNVSVLDKLVLPKQNSLSNEAYKLCFAGGLLRSRDMHTTRLDYVEFLSQTIPIEVYSEIYYLTLSADIIENMQKKASVLTINLLKKLGFSENVLSNIPLIGRASKWGDYQFKLFPASLKKAVRPPVYAMDMYNMFADHKIVFNIHVDNAGDEAGNMRLFEATGVGSCLLTDRKSNLHEFFIPDEEVVVYTSKEECAEKAQWLIANPEKCRAIAAAGMKRTLKDHTHYNRAPIFSESIKKVLASKQ